MRPLRLTRMGKGEVPDRLLPAHGNDNHVCLRGFLPRAGLGAWAELLYYFRQRLGAPTIADNHLIAGFYN